MSREHTAEITAPIIIKYRKELVHHTEECHGIHDFGGWVRELQEVKVCIGDKIIDLSKMLTTDMENDICLQLKEMEENDEI